jgi:6-pyruvoyltetrahydropterin/6-carboxytetrahydropterin synthase
MEITIRVEWDMGHRLPNHGGGCRNLHGHRYAAEVTLRGSVIVAAGAPDEGMVVDFGPVKQLVRGLLEERDHRFLLSESDPLFGQMRHLPGMVFVPFVPTAENIAADLLRQIRMAVDGLHGAWLAAAAPADTARRVQVSRLRLYETPTSYAEAS